MSSFDDASRASFYKTYRDRSAVVLKQKHITQYDYEFGQLTNSTSSMSVLEIGCGSGNFLRYLKHKGHGEIVGIDMDDQLADALSDLNEVEICLDDVANILKTTLKGRAFDRIVLLDVLEHIDFPVLRDLMINLHNHIKADGKILIRVPNIESPWGLKMHFGSFDHVTELGPGRLRELAKLTGWECDGCFAQHPMGKRRRIKQMLANGILAFLLSYKPDIWTANVLTVFSNPDSQKN